MNTSKLADISEIFSSIAVVVTLIFLTLQMQQNTRAIQASTRQASMEADTAYLTNLTNNPYLYSMGFKTDITPEEAVQRHLNLVLFYRMRENDYEQYKRGAIDETTWSRYLSSFFELRNESTRNWWVNYGSKSFDPDFVKIVNGIMEQTPVMNVDIEELAQAYFRHPDEYQRIHDSMIQE